MPEKAPTRLGSTKLLALLQLGIFEDTIILNRHLNTVMIFVEKHQHFTFYVYLKFNNA